VYRPCGDEKPESEIAIDGSTVAEQFSTVNLKLGVRERLKVDTAL
jgi:hypothetical protein